jgi:hypothetical protein
MIEKKLEFIECDSCRVKPGSPLLCESCLNNRNVISELKDQIRNKGEISKGSFLDKNCTCEKIAYPDFDCRLHGR